MFDNLLKAGSRWSLLYRKFRREGAYPQTSGNLKKGGSPGETFVWIGDLVDDSHDRSGPRQIPTQDGLYAEMTTEGIEEVETYVLHYQNNVSQYIANV